LGIGEKLSHSSEWPAINDKRITCKYFIHKINHIDAWDIDWKFNNETIKLINIAGLPNDQPFYVKMSVS